MLAYYPDARRFPSPNYTEGNRGRRAVVVHIAGGGWAGTLSWLRNPASTASSHLVIGEDGAVAQLVSFDDSAWTNGLTWKAGRWRNARGKVVLSTWRLLEAPINPNLQTITIELVGVHTKPRPEQQRRALVTVLVWLAQQLGWASYEVGETLIGHYHLDPVDRPRCPGPHVDLETIAALANPALLPPIPPAPPATAPYATRHYTPVLQSPGTGELRVAWEGRCLLPPGQIVELSPAGPGWLHWAAGGFVEAALVEPVAAQRVYTETSPILAPWVAPHPALLPRLVARCRAANSPYDDAAIAGILGHYVQACERGEVDLYLALAQTLHETGNLWSHWSQEPQRNPAGIGVNGEHRASAPDDTAPGRDWSYNRQRFRWERGLSFPSWEVAVVAQIGRLIAYATTPEQRTPAQQDLVQQALAHRPLPRELHGSAAGGVKALGKAHNPAGSGWASPGADYGARLAAIATELSRP